MASRGKLQNLRSSGRRFCHCSVSHSVVRLKGPLFDEAFATKTLHKPFAFRERLHRIRYSTLFDRSAIFGELGITAVIALIRKIQNRRTSAFPGTYPVDRPRLQVRR